MAGARSDQKLAAIMTPAAKPREVSSTLLLGFLRVKTMVAPKATMDQVKHVASRAWSTG